MLERYFEENIDISLPTNDVIVIVSGNHKFSWKCLKIGENTAKVKSAVTNENTRLFTIFLQLRLPQEYAYLII